MALVEHSFLGPYESMARLGTGRMGEVRRARDTRLGRDVAPRVLSAASHPGHYLFTGTLARLDLATGHWAYSLNDDLSHLVLI
jgi:hypothetical protein